VAYQLKRAGKHSAALVVLLSFDCLLRISEVLSLVKEDVAVASDPRLSGFKKVSVRIRHAKGGNNQWVVVSHPDVSRLLVDLVVSLPSNSSSLFSLSESQYRTLFKGVCSNLGLHASFVPHSLRHGSATQMYINGVGMAEIKKRGRWKQSSTVDHYIQQGPAIAMQHEVKPAYAALGQRISQVVYGVFSLSQGH